MYTIDPPFVNSYIVWPLCCFFSPVCKTTFSEDHGNTCNSRKFTGRPDHLTKQFGCVLLDMVAFPKWVGPEIPRFLITFAIEERPKILPRKLLAFTCKTLCGFWQVIYSSLTFWLSCGQEQVKEPSKTVCDGAESFMLTRHRL